MTVAIDARTRVLDAVVMMAAVGIVLGVVAAIAVTRGTLVITDGPVIIPLRRSQLGRDAVVLRVTAVLGRGVSLVAMRGLR